MGGERGRLVSPEMKALVVSEITEAGKKGVRLYKACVYLDISVRTFERWRAGDYSDKRKGALKSVSKKLSLQERQTIIDTACEARFRDCNPYEIIAILAGEGKYIGRRAAYIAFLKAPGNWYIGANRSGGKGLNLLPSSWPQVLIRSGVGI